MMNEAGLMSPLLVIEAAILLLPNRGSFLTSALNICEGSDAGCSMAILPRMLLSHMNIWELRMLKMLVWDWIKSLFLLSAICVCRSLAVQVSALLLFSVD